MLIGSWEVTRGGTYRYLSPYQTEEQSVSPTTFYFTFEKDGHGKYFREGKPAEEFTYKYNGKDNTIDYQIEGKQYIWYIDLLTEETIIFHGEYEYGYEGTELKVHCSYTYNGKRLK